MARYTGPKDRLSRREGFDLFAKGVRLTRLNIPPGMHGPKGLTRKTSRYSRQLREKQKVKRLYGVLEKQFLGYVRKALKTRGNTGEVLLSLLERRLDNVVYRLGYASTRPQARQMVSHRHVFVNGHIVNIPSYQVKAGQTISLDGKIRLDDHEGSLPGWLVRQAAVGQIVHLPSRPEIDVPVNEQLIVEFYSR